MATFATNLFDQASHAVPSAAQTRTNRPRTISPRAGHALEILGHAIEYLSDEMVEQGISPSAHNPQVQALQLLMALNREIYFDCPVELTFFERCAEFFRVRFN